MRHKAEVGARGHEIEDRVHELLGELTTEEKLSMVHGSGDLWTGLVELARDGWAILWPAAGPVPRLGVRGIRFVDGPRGVVVPGSTTFPVPMARGASWDTALEERIGTAMGLEAAAAGADVIGAVCVNLLRHPAWGRAQETYGEDPAHVGALGVAATRGIQRHVMACVKHFAANSMENARFQVDVRIDERTAHELYLRHFEAIVRAGVAAVMSAYNAVNGEWCGQNQWLLTDVLRTRWGFDGFVMSDFAFGLRDAQKGALAGQDLEMPFAGVFARELPDLIASGEVPAARIDAMVTRLVRAQLRFPPPASTPAPPREEHRALARQSAAEGIVLLTNDGVLPFSGPRRIAVTGRWADVVNTGDHGSSDTRPDHVVTPLEGLRAAVGDDAEILADDRADPAAAAANAAAADVALVVVGNGHLDEGESLTPHNLQDFIDEGVLVADTPMAQAMLAQIMPGSAPSGTPVAGAGAGGDRASLRLSPADEELIRAVAAANPRTVVAVVAGGPVITEGWRDEVAALLMLWYPGQEGGHALADILLGRVAPSGRLPATFPRDEQDLPLFDPDATEITYDLWHGYRKTDRDGTTAAFPFGYGLSYTTFAYAGLAVARGDLGPADTLAVSVEVTNTGPVRGAEVVQLYVGARDSAVERPTAELKAFARVELDAGASRRVELTVPATDLAYWDSARGWVVEPTRHEIRVGRSAADPEALTAVVDVVDDSADP